MPIVGLEPAYFVSEGSC